METLLQAFMHRQHSHETALWSTSQCLNKLKNELCKLLYGYKKGSSFPKLFISCLSLLSDLVQLMKPAWGGAGRRGIMQWCVLKAMQHKLTWHLQKKKKNPCEHTHKWLLSLKGTEQANVCHSILSNYSFPVASTGQRLLCCCCCCFFKYPRERTQIFFFSQDVRWVRGDRFELRSGEPKGGWTARR